MNKNWIKLNRKFQTWEWKRQPSMVALFMHLLLEANWKPGRFEGHVINRGQFPTSLKKLSINTGLSIKQVRNCLAKLENSGEIRREGASKWTMITICNYDAYQGNDTPMGTEREHQGASKGQDKGKQGATIEEGKEGNNEKKVKKSFDPLRVDFPSELGTGDFARAWIDWCAHRSEIKQKLTSKATQMQLKKLAACGSDVACKMIEQSIMNGWTGLFDLKGDGSQNAGPSISDAQRQEQKRLDAVEEERIRRQQEMVDRKLGRVSQ